MSNINTTKVDHAARRRATMKFKRTKTLARKSLKLSLESKVKINLIIYDPRQRRLVEHFTNEDVSLQACHRLLSTNIESCKKEPHIEFISKDIRTMAGVGGSSERDDGRDEPQISDLKERLDNMPKLHDFIQQKDVPKHPSLKVCIDLKMLNENHQTMIENHIRKDQTASNKCKVGQIQSMAWNSTAMTKQSYYSPMKLSPEKEHEPPVRTKFQRVQQIPEGFQFSLKNDVVARNLLLNMGH